MNHQLTVYFDKCAVHWLEKYIITFLDSQWTVISTTPATTAMLYYANQSQYSNPRLFNSSLGQFLISSFVLQREYLFVQVGSCECM